VVQDWARAGRVARSPSKVTSGSKTLLRTLLVYSSLFAYGNRLSAPEDRRRRRVTAARPPGTR
jgi:hypothetical protein